MALIDFSSCVTIPHAYFGDPVTYTRPGETPLTGLTAARTENSQDFEEASGGLILLEGETAFLFEQSAINFGPGAVPPARGDTITDAASAVYTLQSFFPGTDSRAWTVIAKKVDA